MSCVIFGASAFGKTALNHLKDEFDFTHFCDNSIEKQGTLFCGLPVISPSEILDKTVIIASLYNIEIAKQLTEMGFKTFYAAFDGGKGVLKTVKIELGTRDLTVDKKKVCLIRENNSGSNTYAFYRFVKNLPCFDEYNFVMIDEQKKDTDYYYNILTSRIIMKTHDSSNLPGYINTQFWHGAPLKALGFMSRTISEFSEACHKNWGKLNLVFSYSRTYSTLMSACYGIHQNQFFETGMPRNDFLFRPFDRKKASELLGIDANSKWAVYMPTFREHVFGVKNGSAKSYLYNWENFDFAEFDNFLSKKGITLIMKLHVRDKESLAPVIPNLRSIKALDDGALKDADVDFYEMLGCFDVLMTDYSSVYFDYLLLDRPIIFMPADMDEYNSDAGFLLEPYDFWTPGPKAITYEELKTALEDFADGIDNYKEKRKDITKVFHKYTDGNSTGRAFEALKTVIEQELENV